MSQRWNVVAWAAAALLLGGCAAPLPDSGFQRSDLTSTDNQTQLQGVQFVEVTAPVVRQLNAHQATQLFSDIFGDAPVGGPPIGPGDILQVTIWEAPPASLFTSSGSSSVVGEGGASTSGSSTTVLAPQAVSSEGEINVPYAGSIHVAGLTLYRIEEKIAAQLRNKAHEPQVLVVLTQNFSANVAVVGEVTNSILMPLTPRGERLLDAIAEAGGVRQPASKMTIQLARGAKVDSLPMDTIIKDPRQNISLQPGDVVTARFQPLSFMALGATGKNDEFFFEGQGISLAQALARAGGLVDQRSDVLGVFIFRQESKDAEQWPKEPVVTTPEGKVPVIYRVDLRSPNSFFLTQNFKMEDKDLVYISNAPLAELHKVVELFFSAVYPIGTVNNLAN